MNRWVREILDVCEEQGFRTARTGNNSGTWVYPKHRDQGHPIVVHDRIDPSNPGKDDQNVRAGLRRIGVDFGDRPKHRQEIPVSASPTKTDITMTPMPAHLEKPPLTRAREHIAMAIDALSKLEGCLAELEVDASKLSDLRRLLGKL